MCFSISCRQAGIRYISDDVLFNHLTHNYNQSYHIILTIRCPMRSALPFCVLPILFLALSACSKATVDASSEAALEDSLSSFYSTLSPEDSKKLMSDIALLNEYFQTRVYKGEPADEARQEYLKMLDGKTLKQISEQVNKVKPYQAPVQPEAKEGAGKNAEKVDEVVGGDSPAVT